MVAASTWVRGGILVFAKERVGFVDNQRRPEFFDGSEHRGRRDVRSRHRTLTRRDTMSKHVVFPQRSSGDTGAGPEARFVV